MWIFIYGDNPWPAAAETALARLAAGVFLVVLGVLLSAAFRAGKAREQDERLAPPHLRVAIGASAVLLLALLGYQWKVGNLGPRPDWRICADFCTMRGFSGSSMPPRVAGAPSCSCIDGKGSAAETASIPDAAAALKSAGR
jgi:hypothetical protein